jgi:RNA polymerase sigma factor (sigma-70 family)
MHSLATAVVAAPEPLRPQLAPSDLEAVNCVIGGQKEMFEVIVRRYNAQLYRVGMAYLRDHAQAEDAMQNAYLKAFLNLGRFRGTSAFSTWLTRIMINECLMIIRRRKHYTMETLEDASEGPDRESFVAPAFDRLHHQDLKAALEQALQHLPRTHRTVYLLREVQHLSTTETAQCLGMSRDNVKVCLHRAREGLKTQLMKSAAGIELFAYPAQYCDPMTEKVMRAVLGATPNAAA